MLTTAGGAGHGALMNHDPTHSIGDSMKILSLSGPLSILVAPGIIFIGIREFLDPGAGAMTRPLQEELSLPGFLR